MSPDIIHHWVLCQFLSPRPFQFTFLIQRDAKKPARKHLLSWTVRHYRNEGAGWMSIYLYEAPAAKLVRCRQLLDFVWCSHHCFPTSVCCSPQRTKERTVNVLYTCKHFWEWISEGKVMLFFFFNKIMTEIYGRKKRKCILEYLVNQNAWLTKMFGLNSLPQVENYIKNVSHVFCSRDRNRVAALLLRGFGGLPWLNFFWSSSAREARSPFSLIQ